MAVDIRSKEFADAWHLISDALLQLIQGGIQFPNTVSQGNIVDTVTVSGSQEPSAQTQAPPKTPESRSENRGIPEVRYVTYPINTDTGYILKRLKEERQTGSNYKIMIYPDGMCDIELDIQDRRTFRSNQAEWVPPSVGKITGELTPECTIINKKPGKGFFDGKVVKITEPFEVEFK